MDIVSYAMGEGAGYKKGYADGQDSDAYSQGYDKGYSEGYTSGYDTGYDAGFPAGVASVKTVKDLIDVRDAQSLFANLKDTTGGLSADQKIASVLNYSDTENAHNFDFMFNKSDITFAPNFDTSNMTSASSLFANCEKLRNVSLSIDSSKKYGLNNAFYKCSNLHSVSFDNTPKIKDMQSIFNDAMLHAVDDETFPYMDTSEVITFNLAFAVTAGTQQNALRTIPTYDLSGANFVGIYSMFAGRLIIEIPDLILPKLSKNDWDNLFKSKNGFYYFFKGNTALSKLHFTDIYGSLDVSVSTQFTREALLEIIGNLRDMTGSTPLTLTLGATNLAKLTEEDIALATEKNWTVA